MSMTYDKNILQIRMKKVMEAIDEIFGDDFAKSHPDMVGMLMITDSIHDATCEIHEVSNISCSCS